MGDEVKPWIILCTLTAALVMLPNTRASAQSVAQLGDAIAADKIEMSTLQTKMDDGVSENAGLKKEYDVYADQVKTRLDPLVNDYNKRLDTHNQHATNVNAAVEKHNAGCQGTLPAPTFARCKGEESQLQPMINGVNTQKAALDIEKANLAKQQAQYNTAMDGLAAKIKANFAAWEQMKARFDQLKAKLEAEQAALVGRCKNAAADERSSPQFIKYCASFGFDNPKPGLGPLDENAAPKGTRISPN